ncbi:MAG: family 10 glycosylhydrolase, partial [Armatimonadetes bacterium]|nr:family 10 glycosylhydrolase [Armatimonadota bacterium]
ELAACIRAARRYGIEVHVWRVNWCTLGAPKEWLDKLAAEGRLMQRWDGTSMFDDPSADRTPWLCPSDQRNRELERDAMLEVVRRYHPDGIHFDYMRFPSANYCYCDRCRRKFEEATGVRVDQWPADCRPEGRLWGQWVKWRADLITSLAQEIAAEAHRIDPSCKVSLAARALPGAPIYDGQDWPRWCREHILDFVVPMNYTGGDRKRLQQVISDQLGAIGQSVPLYSGLGVTYRPESLSDPVTMSSQIVLARELGAQGFVIFVWNDVLKAALPALREGVCRSRVSLLPHRSVDIPVKFDWRAPDFEPPLPARVFPFNQPPTVTVRVSVPAGRSGEGVLRVAPCAGGAAVAEQKVKLAGPTTARIALPAVAGVFEVQIAGSVGAGKLNFFRRSLPLRLLTGTQMEQLTARLKPPQFSGGGIRVGVAVGGYGSDGILSALVDSRQFLVAPLYSLSRDFLASCQVVVVPQLRSDVEAQFNAHIDELREFVRNGGGLLLTHDAVGMRAHRPVFPELATALPRPVRSRTVQVATGHTITDRLPKQFDHSYYDHIALVPESGALTLLRDEQGNAVAVAFQYGKGRVVACGMAVGLREDDTEAPPLDGELDFLVNAIHWLATTR